MWMLLDVPLVIRVPARSSASLSGVALQRRASKPVRALWILRRPPHRWGLVWCWLAWCVGSLFGQALPPPAGTAAWPQVA